MLVMTPAAKRMLRKERRRERDSLRGKVGQIRHETIVTGLARMIRTAHAEGQIATLFGLEGPLRASLRSTLCLQGWRFAEAEAAAVQLVDAALATVCATRPSWNEGQPEWTIEQGTLIERTRCARCHKPLPEGHYKFCGRLCSTTYNSWLADLRRADETNVIRIAARMA